uniref:Coiled-coil domain containing 106b n=1 Tax=Salarias fasciatus TaxID=181472 RepID=A0A672I682_SALFA
EWDELTKMRDLPHSQYSSFILVSNLRAHLYVTLEKNAWLQKRIEELEEERNFLRCQLDRFIVSMRPPEGEAFTTLPSFENRLFGHWHNGVYEEEDEEEDEEDSLVEKGIQTQTAQIQPRFSASSAVKDPDGVLIRYKKILTTYQRVRSMSRAFQIHGVDRNTMASTSPIAELLLVAPEKMAEVGEFEASKEKLLDYARRCYKTMDEDTHTRVQTMKKTHKLLPISYRFRN